MAAVDPFARFRTDAAAPETAPAPAKDASPYVNPEPVKIDPFERYRIEGPNIARHNNTLGEELRAGVGSGVDNLQAGMYGTAGLMGRELGIGWLEKVGMEGAAENFEQAGKNGRQAGGFTDIESAGGFFKSFSASLGEAVPSIALAWTGGGIGAKVGQKAVELGVKKSMARNVERRLAKYGFGREESLISARNFMLSKEGQKELAWAYTSARPRAIIDKAAREANKIGRGAGAVAAASLPMIGRIDQELLSSGIADPGLTALLGGIVGGALEAVPALRLLDKMFPGVDKQVSKQFVKDFAVSTGTQMALEGSTEAAQEIIQLAALAYHDPTFDMFSPDARNRVIDAFAAGAAVGAVTGGGAEAIGAVQKGAFSGVKAAMPVIGTWSMDAMDAAKAVGAKAKGVAGRAMGEAQNAAAGVASIGAAASTDIGAKVEEQLPEGFVAADNTMFQEIKGRVFGVVQPHIEAAVNSVSQQIDKVSKDLNDNLEGGLNAETAKISDVAKAAREKLLKNHDARLKQMKTYLTKQTERVAKAAKAIQDPAAREKYITDQLQGIKERLSGYVERFRRDAAQMNKDVETEIDNMDFTPEMIEALNIVPESEQQAAPSDDVYEPGTERDAQTGETHAQPIMTFGHMQAQPQVMVSGKEDVRPYRTKAAARLGRAALGRRFMGGTKLKKDGTDRKLKDTFRIIPHEGGGYVIEVIDPEVKDAQKFYNDLESIRGSYDRVEGDNDGRKVQIENFDGEKFGFPKRTKHLNLDVQSMAYKGKNLDKTASTDMDGFLAFAGELMQRGMINKEDFGKLHDAAVKYFDRADRTAQKEQGAISDRIQQIEAAMNVPQSKESKTKLAKELSTLKNQQGARKSFDERAKTAEEQEAAETEAMAGDGKLAPRITKPQAYDNDGAAWAALSEFLEEMDAKGIPYPFADKLGWAGRKPGWKDKKTGKQTKGGRSQGAKLFTVVKNKDGSWSWGIDRSSDGAKTYKALRGKEPEAVKAVHEAMRQRRRDEYVDAQTRKEGAFSVNQTLAHGGDLGDRTGQTAGDPDVVVNRNTRRQESLDDGPRQPLNPTDSMGRQQMDLAEVAGAQFPGTRMADPNDRHSGNQRVSVQLNETLKAQQSTDMATDPDNKDNSLRPEFDDRKEELQRTTRGKNKYTSPRAKKEGMEQTDADWKRLDELKRTGLSMMLGGKTAKKTQAALQSLANFVTKTLGLTNSIVVMDRAGLAQMIERGWVQDPAFQETLDDPSIPARNIRTEGRSFIYLSDKILSDPVMTVLAFGHELGHHVYRVGWDKLNLDGQRRLINAYTKETGNKVDFTEETTGEGKFQRVVGIKTSDPQFNEWMADQLAAWLAKRAAPKNQVEAFFAKIAGQVRRLYDFISKHPRFQLNETYKEFADAIVLQAKDPDALNNPLGKAQMKAWFKNEGVTMYGWFGEALVVKNNVKQSKSVEPHSIAERQDMAYRRRLEQEHLQAELDYAEKNADYDPETNEHMQDLRMQLAEREDMLRSANTSMNQGTGEDVTTLEKDIKWYKEEIARWGKAIGADPKRPGEIKARIQELNKEIAQISREIEQQRAREKKNKPKTTTTRRKGKGAEVDDMDGGTKKERLAARKKAAAKWKKEQEAPQSKPTTPEPGFESPWGDQSGVSAERLAKARQDLAKLKEDRRTMYRGRQTSAINDEINQLTAWIQTVVAHRKLRKEGTPKETAEAAQQQEQNEPSTTPISAQEQADYEEFLAHNRNQENGGENDDSSFDFRPTTQEGRQALARFEATYPRIAGRSALITNWMMSAYKMALAPAVSTVRGIAVRVPVAGQLVTMFHRGKMGDAKSEQNYIQAVLMQKAEFAAPHRALRNSIEADIVRGRPALKRKKLGSNKELDGLINNEMRSIGKSLTKKDGDLNATFTANEQAVRDLFDAMHAYAVDAGLPVRKVVNYFPRQFDKDLLRVNKQKILDHLVDEKGIPLRKAREIYGNLFEPTANDGRSTIDATETPGFLAMNSRNKNKGIAGNPFFDQFLDDNVDGIVTNYINQVVKRAEFNRRLGEAIDPQYQGLDANELIAKGVWDPKAKMHKILDKARRDKNSNDQDIKTLEKYIDANLGQLGRDDINQGVRKVMAGVMAYQNMRVLLFTVFASLPDMAGPAIRSNDPRLAWTTLKDHIKNIATDENALHETALAYGVISDTMTEHMMTEYVDNHYMSPTARKMNDNFFKYTGLDYYTNFTRKYALAVGKEYLKKTYETTQKKYVPPAGELTAEQKSNHRAAFEKEQARAKDMLAELGLKPDQLEGWVDNMVDYNSQAHVPDGNERKIAEALVQFVDESIMRPNASQRPILASHPATMLVYHLKNYMFAIHDIILKRIKFNIDESDTPVQYGVALLGGLMMVAMTAVGLELREKIQYAGSNRKPPTDRMDGWEYTWELLQRSGLTGITQIAFDFQGAEDRGQARMAGVGGPTISQMGDIISKPSTQTIPKAIPVVGQIPALRNAVRSAM